MLWIKAFHIIAMVCWFAAMFYLPRLFVYHALSDDETSNERFKIMERKLYRGIATPSALLTLVFGLILLMANAQFYMQQGWMHAKLTLVILLFAYHGLCGKYLRAFANNANQKSHVFYRWFNEAPVIALITIVILVIVRPF